MTSRVLRSAFLVSVLSAGVSACAAIWGFQDAIDPRDAGDDGLASTVDATSLEAGSSEPDGATEEPGSPGADTLEASVGGDGDGGGGASLDAPATMSSESDAPGSDAATTTDGSSVSCPGACTPPLPTGWAGPFELYELQVNSLDGGVGPSASVPPACASVGADGGAPWTLSSDLHGSPNAAPATCGCSCGPVSGAVCSPVANYFSDPACRSPCGRPAIPLPTGCAPIYPTGGGTGPCAGARLSLGGAITDAGACAATDSVQVPGPTWFRLARLCASAPMDPGLCTSGTCVSAPTAGFEDAYCITSPGDAPCPATGYTVLHTSDDAGSSYYTGAVDSRGCTSCGCEIPSGLSCSADVSTYADRACGMPIPYSFCMATDPGPMSAEVATAAVGGSCASVPGGGQPTGSLRATGPYTVCCTQ
jgi:hypothetical protein